MAKGFTYIAIDTNGEKVTRYSAGHLSPRYTFVVLGSGMPGFRANSHSAETERQTRQTMYDRLGGIAHKGTRGEHKMVKPYCVSVTAVGGNQTKS